MLEPRVSVECPTDVKPNIRIKVVPASFGIDGFEEAVWEAVESMMKLTATSKKSQAARGDDGGDSPSSARDECFQPITLVVAAPDLFTDPILLDGISPQTEFESDRFRVFSSTLSEKIAMSAKMEGGVPSLDNDIQITTHHPLWRMSSPPEKRFPYPCVEVSTKVGSPGGDDGEQQDGDGSRTLILKSAQ